MAVMPSFTVAVLLAVVVVSSAPSSVSAASTQLKPFSFTDSVVVSVSTAADRNVVLPQVQAMWRTVLSNLYQATGVTVTIVNDHTDTTLKQVQLKIAGRSSMTINVADAKAAFRQSFMDSPITGIDTVKASATVSTSMKAGSDSMMDTSSTSSKPFSFTDSVVISLTVAADRSVVLPQVQAIWRSVLSNLYQATGVSVTISNDHAGSFRKEVQLKVAGRSSMTVNVAEAKAAFRQSFMDSPITGLETA